MGGEELYDIETDPYEWTNLASVAKHHAKLTEMRALAPNEMKPKSKQTELSRSMAR